jgi:hypothetical protein
VVRIAHVRIFRLVTDFRRKFRVTAVDVRDVRRQQRLIAVMPNWKRKGQDLNKTGHVARRCASRSFPNAISSSGGITFRLVDLVNGCKELSRSDHKVRNAATKFARWTIIVPRRILNIGETSDGKANDRSESKKSFHRRSLPVKGFRTVKAILYFWCLDAASFFVFNMESQIVTPRMSTIIPSETTRGNGRYSAVIILRPTNPSTNASPVLR